MSRDYLLFYSNGSTNRDAYYDTKDPLSLDYLLVVISVLVIRQKNWSLSFYRMAVYI